MTIDANGWNDDMESAPGDGTSVLLWLRAPWSRSEVACWHELWGLWVDPGITRNDAQVSGIASCLPSHWQPLPPPPVAP